MRNFSFLLCSIVILLLATLSAGQLGGNGPMMGGWNQQSDPNKQNFIVGAARFGINKVLPKVANLEFHVLSAQTQVVAGTNFKIYVAVRGNKIPCKVYALTVWGRLDGTYVLSDHWPVKDGKCVTGGNVLWYSGNATKGPK